MLTRVNLVSKAPTDVREMSGQCSRCGKRAAADGHPTFGEWEQCVATYRFEKQLAQWAREWSDSSLVVTVPTSVHSSGKEVTE